MQLLGQNCPSDLENPQELEPKDMLDEEYRPPQHQRNRIPRHALLVIFALVSIFAGSLALTYLVWRGLGCRRRHT
jgi:hypothetical protein